jgi:hypothetical protein
MITITKETTGMNTFRVEAVYPRLPNGSRVLKLISNVNTETHQYASACFSPNAGISEEITIFEVRHIVQIPYVSATIVADLDDENDLGSARGYDIKVKFFPGGSPGGVRIPGIDFGEIDDNWQTIVESLLRLQAKQSGIFDPRMLSSIPTYI